MLITAPDEAAYLFLCEVSHTGQSKVRLSPPGASRETRASHMSTPQAGQIGRSMWGEFEGTDRDGMAVPRSRRERDSVSQPPAPTDRASAGDGPSVGNQTDKVQLKSCLMTQSVTQSGEDPGELAPKCMIIGSSFKEAPIKHCLALG